MSIAAALRQEHDHPYLLTQLSNVQLLRDLKSLLARERASTALLLAHIAEVDARRLYVPAGCASMFTYCVEKLHLSEDAAYRRIRAARAARQFPVLFDAVAEGRIHLAAVSTIAPFLTAENVGELIEAATYRRKSEVEELLASRFPSVTPEPRTVVRALGAPAPQTPCTCESNDQLVLGRVEDEPVPSERACDAEVELVLGRVDTSAKLSSATTSLSSENAQRFLLQVAISKSTHDNLLKAQALLSHLVPNGDVAQVLDRALGTLIAQLETRKVGALKSRPRAGRSGAIARRRYIPAHIRRAVWERDGARCTFAGDDGNRCSETRLLEFDHIEPFARQGRATVDGLRLRCRAHNQHEAERVFGSGFMSNKRKQARERAAATVEKQREMQDIVSGLRALGCGLNEAKRAAEFGLQRGDTLEERLRAALQSMTRRPAG